MEKLTQRLLRLSLGLFLYALGIAITLKAQIGYAPWDAFHAGLAKKIGISIGTASISVGVVIIIITALLKERIGLGSLSNMIVVGLLLDLILALDILPTAKNFPLGVLMMVSGLFVIAFATYFYIGSGFGAGPRDSLMVALARKTKLPIGICRAAIELGALLSGWWLGGMVGIGTAISALMAGFSVQLVFKVLNFEPTQIKHQGLDELLTFAKSARAEHK